MVDEARLLIERLTALTEEATALVESPLATERANQLAATQRAVHALRQADAPVPSGLLDQMTELQKSCADCKKADEVVNLVRQALHTLSSRLPRPKKRTESPRTRRSPAEQFRKGVLLPISAYEEAILVVLRQMGGQATREKALKAVHDYLGDRLQAEDHKVYESQGNIPRWEYRAGTGRRKLQEKGLLRGDTKNTIWALTEAGMDPDATR